MGAEKDGVCVLGLKEEPPLEKLLPVKGLLKLPPTLPLHCGAEERPSVRGKTPLLPERPEELGGWIMGRLSALGTRGVVTERSPKRWLL